MSTKTRFEKQAKGNSEMVYYGLMLFLTSRCKFSNCQTAVKFLSCSLLASIFLLSLIFSYSFYFLWLNKTLVLEVFFVRDT